MKEAFKLRNHPNLHLVYFEDLKKNPFEEIKKISEFLGFQRTEKQIQNVRYQTLLDSIPITIKASFAGRRLYQFRKHESQIRGRS